MSKKMRNRFFKILDLCEEYKNIHTDGIARVRYNSHAEAKNLRIIAGTAVFAALSPAVLLAFVLIVHVLTPVCRLALEADREGEFHQSR